MILQSAVALLTGSGGFDVEDDVVGFEEGADVEAFEFAVGDGCNSGVEFLTGGKFVDYSETVLALDGGGVGPGVEDGDIEVILFEGLDDVDDLGVAYVGAVFLECETEDEDVTVENLYAFFEHEFDDTVSDIDAHAVVHAATGEYDFGIIAIALCALCEIVRVDTDTVATDESGFEGKEVPLGGCGFENVGGVDAHKCEYFRQFIDERDVDVTLGVLDDFSGFCNFD